MNKLITTLICTCTFNALADTTTQSPDGKATAVIYRAGMITSLDNAGNRQVVASITISPSPGKTIKGRYMVTECDSMKGGAVITLDEKTDKPTAKVFPWHAKAVTMLDDIAMAICHESSYAAASENKGHADSTVKMKDGSTAVAYRNGLITSFDKAGNRQVNALVTVFLSPGQGARERLTVTGCDSKKGGKVLNMDVETGKPNGTWEPWFAKATTMLDEIAIAICREGAVAASETKTKR